MRKYLSLVLYIIVLNFVVVPVARGQTYTVKSGDTLWGIAQKSGLSVQQLQATNGITSDKLAIGQHIVIPDKNTSTSLSAATSKPVTKVAQSNVYSVSAGDTLWGIAQKYHTTVEQLKEVNGLSTEALKIGQNLLLPSGAIASVTTSNSTTQPVTSTANTTPTDKSAQVYTVQQGDTLCSLADRFKTSVEQLMNINNMEYRPLKVGEKITIPDTTLTAVTDSSSSSVTQQNQASTSSDNTTQTESSRGATAIRDIISNAYKYQGTPYLYGGASPQGFDCSGFVYYIFNLSGITLPRDSYSQFNYGQSVDRDQLQPGDLVFFCTEGSDRVNHVGIYLGDDNFIHSSSTHGVVVNNLNETYYLNCYSGARRVITE